MDRSHLEQLANLRHRLRLKAEALVEAYEALSAPETALEVERAAKAGLMLDRLLVKLFETPEILSAPPQVNESGAKAPTPRHYAPNTPEWMKKGLTELDLKRAQAVAAKGLGPQPSPDYPTSSP
jgi:hypothetical protein